MKTNIKGFAPISIIFIFTGALLVGGGIWYWQKNKVVNNNSVANNQQATSTIKEMNQSPGSTWLTYKNDKYGFEFQYPQELDLNEKKSNYILSKNLINEKRYQSVEIGLRSRKNPKAWMGIEIVLNSDQSLNDAALEDIAIISQNEEMGGNTNFSSEAVATSSEIIGGLNAEKIVYNNAYVKEGVVIKDNANLYIVDQFGIDNFNQILSTFKFEK